MTEPAEAEPSPPGWTSRRKRLLAVAASTFALVLALGLAVVYYVWSGGFDRYVTGQVVSALAEYGVRAEIGGLELSGGVRTAKLHDIKLYNQETGQLVATIDRAVLVVEIPG